MQRVHREQAQEDLRFMRTIRVAVAAIVDKGAANSYSRVERALLDQIRGEVETEQPAATRSNLAKRLIRMGALANYGDTRKRK